MDLTSGIGTESTVAGPTASMRKSRLALYAIASRGNETGDKRKIAIGQVRDSK